MIKRSKFARGMNLVKRDSKLKKATRAFIERMEPRILFSGSPHDLSQTAANLLFDGPVAHGNNVDLQATPATQLGNVVQRVYTNIATYGGGNTVSVATVAVGHVGPHSPAGSASVRLSDGTFSQTITDLQSNGFGTPWGVTRSWSNNPGYPDNGRIGNGWMISQEPQIFLTGTTSDQLGSPVLVVTSSSSAQYFTSINGNDTAPIYAPESWSHNSLKYANNAFVLTDTQGNQTTFFGFGSTIPAAQQGEFESYQPASGQEIQAFYSSQGVLTSESRSENNSETNGQLITESYLYSYYASGPNIGEIETISLEQQVGSTGTPTLISQASYDYYDGTFNAAAGEAFGNLNDLRLATITDGQGNITSQDYYRYYVPNDSDTNGYVGGLKYAIIGVDFSNFAASLPSGTTPFTADVSQLQPYADLYLQYGSQTTVAGNQSLDTATYSFYQVTKEVVSDSGSTTSPGSETHQTYLFNYGEHSTFSNPVDIYNTWYYQTTETFPDLSTQLVYSNADAQVMLTVTTLGGVQSMAFTSYTSRGQISFTADSAAILGYNASWGGLVGSSSSDYSDLSPNSGLIDTTQYYDEYPFYVSPGLIPGWSSVATSSTPGFVPYFEAEESIQLGTQGTRIVLNSFDYFARPVGTGITAATIYLAANELSLNNNNASGGQLTSYTYSNWNNFQPQTLTTVRTPFANNQNGTPDTSIRSYDADGNEISYVDGSSTLTQTYNISDGVATTPDNIQPPDLTSYDAPTSAADIYNLIENQPLVTSAATGILSNDTDPDPSKTLYSVLLSNPTDGVLTLQPDGSFSYTPNSGFVGTDSFQYLATDENQHSEATTVTLTTMLPPPSDVTASPLDATHELLDWDYGTTSVQSFYVAAVPHGQSVNSVSPILVNDATARAYTFNGLTPEQNYDFYVWAQNSSNDSQKIQATIAPIVPLTMSGPTVISEGQAASFIASGSSISNLGWSVKQGGTVVATGTGNQLDFTPSATGSFAITVTGNDSTGTSRTASANLTVTNLPPQVTISGAGIGFVGKTQEFASQVIQAPGVNSSPSYAWQVFNSDGSAYSPSITGSLSTFVVPGSLAVGDYSVGLTVTNSTGGSSTATYNFSVLATPSGSGDFDFGAAPAAGRLVDIGMATNAVVEQPDGKIIVAGNGNSYDEGSFIARFNADLTLDTTFGPAHTGVIYPSFNLSTGINITDLVGLTLDPQNNDDLIAVGEVSETPWLDNPVHPYLFVAEYATEDFVTSDPANGQVEVVHPGDFDPNFAGGGPKILTSQNTISAGYVAKVMSDGSILVGGVDATPSTSDSTLPINNFLLVKLSSDGSTDWIASQPDLSLISAQPAFSTASGDSDASMVFDAFSSDGIQSIAILPNGKILAGGTISRGPDGYDGSGFALVRYNSDGTVDNSFGTSTVDGDTFTFTGSDVLYGSSDGDAGLDAMTVLANGDVLAAGLSSSAGAGGVVTLVEYDLVGNLDTAYGDGNGFIETSLEYFSRGNGGYSPTQNPQGEQASLTFESDEQLVVSTGTTTSSWSLFRINTNNGQLDTSFGAGGQVIEPAPVAPWPGEVSLFASAWLPGTTLITNGGIISVGLGFLGHTGTSSDPDTTGDWSDDWAEATLVPIVTRYRLTPDPSVDDVSAVASEDGPVDLSWESNGFGADGFEILRATTVPGLNSSTAVIANVGSDQYDFVDTTASPDTSYYYQIIPYSTGSSGQAVPGTNSSPVSVHTLPTTESGYQLQETIEVPLDGSAVTSNTVLAAGQTYLIVVSGVVQITDQFSIDAGNWYSKVTSQPPAQAGEWGAISYRIADNDTDGTIFNDMAIGVTLADGTSATSYVPAWGAADTDTHSYTLAHVGDGQALTFNFASPTYPTTTSNDAYANSPLEVKIYALQLSGSVPTQIPVRRIVSPAASSSGILPVISQNTPIEIVSANSDGTTSEPWALWLVSSSGNRTLLSSSDASIGNAPDGGATAALLNPSLYANGQYTLELTSSTDPTSTVVDSRVIAIESIAKTGELTFSATDATVQTPVGPLAITRVYNSSRLDQTSYFGPGWTLGLLDSQMNLTSQADTLDPTQTSPVYRAGDLISFTVPDGGTHVFEFDPIPTSDSTLIGGLTGQDYIPTFVDIDGSGARLTLSAVAEYGTNTSIPTTDYSLPVLTYDSAHNEFVDLGRDFEVWPDSQANVGFNPSRIVFDGVDADTYEYQLTTAKGTSYGINATTGQIQSVSDSYGNTVLFQTNGNTITAVDQSGKTLLTIQTDDNHQITSIQIPDQDVIQYDYEQLDGQEYLAVAHTPSGTTNYSYQTVNSSYLLTSVVNSGGVQTLGAEYNSTGGLQALITAAGVRVPVSTFGLGSDQVVQTSVDANGDISEQVYDEKNGTLLRNIQTVTDASDNVTEYVVTVMSYSYIDENVGAVTSLGYSGVELLQSVQTYTPFEILGSDSAGLRYTQQPDADSWAQQMLFDASDDINDRSSEQIVSVSQRTMSDGTLKTTLYGNYVWVAADIGNPSLTLSIPKPELVTVEIQTPDANAPGGYENQIQSTTYYQYNSYGQLLYSLVPIAADPDTTNDPGGWIAEGTQYLYEYGDHGAPTGTQTITGIVTADGSISPDDIAIVATTSQTSYYTDDSAAGSLYGAPQTTTDAAGQETYYAYDDSGNTVLQYTYKTWTDSSGNLVSGWVGTTNVYDSDNRLIDSYQATYLSSDPGVLNTSLDSVLGKNVWQIAPPTGDPGLGDTAPPPTKILVFVPQIDVDETVYSAPLRTVHNDYNYLGQIVDTIDQYGGETTYTYDANGNTIKTVYPDGTQVLSVYDALNRVIWTTNRYLPSGPATSIIATYTQYNQLGQVVETQQYQGTLITQTTGSSGFPASQTPTGSSMGMLISTTQTFFDAAGRAIETISPNGLRTGTIYYPDGQVQFTGILSSSAPDGGHAISSNGVTTQAFTTADFATVTVNGASENTYAQNIYNQYDSALGLFYSTSVDQLGHATKTYTDAEGRTVRTVYDDGSFTETLYSVGTTPVTVDQEGDSIAVPTINGNDIVISGYEEVQIAQRKSGDAPVITIDLYNADKELTDVWLPGVVDAGPNSQTGSTLVNPHWHYDYDTAGNEIDQISGNGNAAGADSADYTTNWKYDQNGNKVEQTLPDGEMQTWTYDIYENNISHKVFNASNHSVALQTTLDIYDTTAAHGGRLLTEDRYASDQPVGSTVMPDEATTYTYDDSTTLPTAEQTDQGNIAEVDDYVLQSGALVETDFTHYTYDPISGNQASITTADGTIHYIYDEPTGELIETWTGANASAPQSSAQNDVKYGYTNQGQLASVTQVVLNGTTPPAVSGTTRYDADGHAISTTQPTTLYTYDSTGNLVTTADPNGDTTVYSYNNLNEVTNELITDTNTNEPIFHEQTDWQNNGQKQDVIDTRYNADGSLFGQITYTWTYDADNRLLNETLTVSAAGTSGGTGTSMPTAYSDTFAYDLDNNQVSEAEATALGQTPTETIVYTYNGDDQLLVETGTGISNYVTTYTYDGNTTGDGNLVGLTRTGDGPLVSTYNYDLRNRMISADNGGLTATFTYDYNGVLISEAASGVTTYYLNDPNNPSGNSKAVQESLSPGGAPTTSYVLGLRVEAQSDTTNGTRYLLVDGHGSTRALSDSSGAVVSGQTFDYDAFGTTLTNASTAQTDLLFGGDGVYDHATGWTYQLARWRNGFRFTTRDTFAGVSTIPASLQKYAYAESNPILGHDPTGHDDDDDGWDDGDDDGAFGDAGLDVAEDVAGYEAVENYLGENFGSIGEYTALGFATGDLLAAATAFDGQAILITVGTVAGGAIGGALLEGGIDALALADEGGGELGSDAVEDLEEIGEDEAEEAGECGSETSCFLAGTVVLRGDGTTETPIQDIEVGDRVATDGGVANSADGKTAATDPNATLVNRKTWREVTIEAGDWEIETLEPLSWIRAEHLRDGDSLDLNAVVDLQEMGVPAGLVGTVESITSCPTIQSGPGRVVLTTVNHLNDDVYDLTLKDAAGNTETLGVTGTHRFYDRVTGWVQVQNMYQGETLRGASGDLKVVGIMRAGGLDRVYNMTVETDHVYYVGELQALVHNVCGEEDPGWEDTGWESREEALEELESQRQNIQIWNELGNAENAESAARTLEYMEAAFEQEFGELPPDYFS